GRGRSRQQKNLPGYGRLRTRRVVSRALADNEPELHADMMPHRRRGRDHSSGSWRTVGQARRRIQPWVSSARPNWMSVSRWKSRVVVGPAPPSPTVTAKDPPARRPMGGMPAAVAAAEPPVTG